jgi:hypothetical protein
MMEFCGRPHDYFSRVKAAGRKKLLEVFAARAIHCGGLDKPIHFMGFQRADASHG